MNSYYRYFISKAKDIQDLKFKGEKLMGCDYEYFIPTIEDLRKPKGEIPMSKEENIKPNILHEADKIINGERQDA